MSANEVDVLRERLAKAKAWQAKARELLADNGHAACIPGDDVRVCIDCGEEPNRAGDVLGHHAEWCRLAELMEDDDGDA